MAVGVGGVVGVGVAVAVAVGVAVGVAVAVGVGVGVGVAVGVAVGAAVGVGVGVAVAIGGTEGRAQVSLAMPGVPLSPADIEVAAAHQNAGPSLAVALKAVGSRVEDARLNTIDHVVVQHKRHR